MANQRLEIITSQIAGNARPSGSPIPQRNVLPLTKDWFFRQADGDESAQTFRPTAMFPTNIHLDLLAHKLIPDPFIGMNEKKVQWVGEKEWIYKHIFPVPKEFQKGQKAVLVFEGLDTFATVRLDGKVILESKNMFLTHRVEIQQLLTGSSSHVLEITFQNALEKGRAEVAKYPEHAWGVWNGDISRTAARKAQYHYGWDWGPQLMTCGPWKEICLELYAVKLSDLSFRVALSDDLNVAEISATAEVEGEAENVKFEISIDNKLIVEQTVSVSNGIAKGILKIQDPQLWWPFTHGSQPLYSLKAILSNSIDSSSSLADVASKTFGIRKVELVQKSLLDDSGENDGTSFFFQINNTPMFITGSCWIPGDSFTPRITAQKYHDWVALSRRANQAMIRVWGGGIYESEHFYNACDELGVLVWQDFMFACANYPAYPEMLESIQAEAEQNVKRLRHHPSIVIWAGNNEDYLYLLLAGLKYDHEDKDPQSWLKSNFPARYIYEHLLPNTCSQLIPDTSYHPGSPFGGAMAMDPTVGDIHQWGVWHLDKEPYQTFDKLGGRFVSEFGMQGFPVKKTVEEYFENGAQDKQWAVGTETVEWHNKATGAADTIKGYLDYNLPYSTTSLESFIYSTQLVQSEALATAYRSWKRDWKGPGLERCGGLLVWQLNDCWPVTSWSVADYSMRPKMAFYAIKRESMPITTAIKREGDRLEVWVTNLTLEKVRADIQMKAWDVRSGREIFNEILQRNFVLEPNRTTDLSSFAIPSNLGSEATVVAIYLLQEGSVLCRHVNFHEPLIQVPFREPKQLDLKIRTDEAKNTTWLEANAEVPVKGLFIEVEGVDADNIVWEDNGVDLVPSEVSKLYVKGLKPGDEGKLKASWLLGSS